MQFLKFNDFERLQILRVVGKLYQEVKHSFRLLDEGLGDRKEDLYYYKKIKNFNKNLENKLNQAIKELGDDFLMDVLYLMPNSKYNKKRGKKKKIKVGKRF